MSKQAAISIPAISCLFPIFTHLILQSLHHLRGLIRVLVCGCCMDKHLRIWIKIRLIVFYLVSVFWRARSNGTDLCRREFRSNEFEILLYFLRLKYFWFLSVLILPVRREIMTAQGQGSFVFVVLGMIVWLFLHHLRFMFWCKIN